MKSQLISWVHEYRNVIAYLVTGLIVLLLRARTPAQWVALGETRPRSQGLIKALRGLGLDPAKVLEGLLQFATGRVRPVVASRLTATQRAGLERARAALIAVVAAEQSDEDRAALARINELLAAPQEPASPSSSEPGFAERGILAVIAGVALLALGITLLTGCPMPAADGCSPGSRRCHEDTPQVCSPGQRWTPADVTCSTVGASCVVRGGVPACLRGEQ